MAGIEKVPEVTVVALAALCLVKPVLAHAGATAAVGVAGVRLLGRCGAGWRSGAHVTVAVPAHDEDGMAGANAPTASADNSETLFMTAPLGPKGARGLRQARQGATDLR